MDTTYIQGVRAMLPVLMGVIPIAFVTGVAAVNCGMTQEQAMLSSIIMYAAAAQLVVYEMLGNNAEGVLIFIAATVLNLRFLLYSAGIAPHLQSIGITTRFLGAYALTDQSFGVTMVQYQKESKMSCTRFYLGAAATMWIVYQFAAAAGIYLGESLSTNYSLDFAVPLTFSALVVPLLNKPEQRVAAAVSAILAVVFVNLSNNLGFFVATFFGIVVGCVYKYFRSGETVHA